MTATLLPGINIVLCGSFLQCLITTAACPLLWLLFINRAMGLQSWKGARKIFPTAHTQTPYVDAKASF